MKYLLKQIERNHFETLFSFQEEPEKFFSSPTSIYLPPREAEFLESILANGWKMKDFLEHALKKYHKLLVRYSNENRRIRKRIQSREQKKKRFCFRPDASSWVEVQFLSLGLGVSCCIVVLELIRFEMNELLRKFLDRISNLGVMTTNQTHIKKLKFHFNPVTKTISKEYIYCRGQTYTRSND